MNSFIKDLHKIEKYFRAANYISVAEIYLAANFLVESDLDFSHIKSRLLGHWGTCPGINFVYAHLQYLISRNKLHMIFVNGPGHGAAAMQANLYIEGSLKHFYPKATHDYSGLSYVIKEFSWPYGFPSHTYPGTPGSILEGGELGYSLATAYGAVLDNPDLIAVCLIGDGEAETGALATSWHLNKFLDPRHNGAVLPILHLNGYKISGPTIFGRMSVHELISLFVGYGYQPYLVELMEGKDIHFEMAEKLNKAIEQIKLIRSKSKNNKDFIPCWPLIILRTPKGWTGVKFYKGDKIEGNYLSHQVPLKNAASDAEELLELQKWLRSYRFNELFDKETGFIEDILDIIPSDKYKMGLSPFVQFESRSEIEVPDASLFCEYGNGPAQVRSSSMRRLGEFLKAILDLNKSKRNFRIFSPDEIYSNKIDKVFEATKRAFVWPKVRFDRDTDSDGMVIEMLSEQALFGLLQGYTLTGRGGIFISYEAFVQIISSMADQYLKFVKVARDIPWRPKYHSLNIVLTSSGWRQDHNGFTHQNPGFLSNIIEKGDSNVKVFFPLDGNCTLAVMEYCLKNTFNGINIIVAGKTAEHVWLDIHQARRLVNEKFIELDFVSENGNADIVFCGIGDYVTKELIAARQLLKKHFNKIKIKFLYVIDLEILRSEIFDEIFTPDKSVIFNFHGYPDTLKKILFDRGNTSRFYVNGYIENGSTTTPYDMHIRNKTSRWHVLIQALDILYTNGLIGQDDWESVRSYYNKKIEKYPLYVNSFGVDEPEIIQFETDPLRVL